jgi:single-stranded DNA-binding protein
MSRQIASLTGKVAGFREFPVTNGKKIFLSVATDIKYRDASGNLVERTEFIEFEDYSSNDKPKKVYDYLHQGDRIQIGFMLRQNVYVDKNTNKTQYRQYAQVRSIDLLETKGATEHRPSANLTARAQGQAVAAVDDTPITDMVSPCDYDYE